MKRLDALVAVVIALLATFVGREALRARSGISTRTASYGTARLDTLSSSLRSTDSARLERPLAALPDGGLEDTRRRLELSASGTFIHEVLAAHDSALARWPARIQEPLRVWVQPSVPSADFREDFVPVVRRAFSRWSESGIPVSFTFLMDSALADIHVTWVDQFVESISGKTIWAHDDKWWIVDASIQLALRHRSGEALDSTAVGAIAMHEVGHLLGLDHTADTTSIMAPKVRVRDLSPADRATVQLLYRLPAGRLK
jgi:cation diffusion facilitator CzcD-associated flavoprotein CzcO